jgi:superfamily II DNA or RNA helicase
MSLGTQPARVLASPVQVARLAATTVWIGGDELITATIQLRFEYGGAAPRDRAAESHARRVLESLGAVDLSCLDDLATETPADYAVRLDSDVHALCSFTAHAVPQLRALGWRVDVDADYPWQTVEPTAPNVATISTDEPERPDWFGLELGVEIDGHRVDLMPALLEILDGAASLEALARTPRRCIAVPVGDRRWLPVPPERLRLLLLVLRELYRDAAPGVGHKKLGAPMRRAAALAELGVALHDPVRPLRWEGATHVRDTGYDLALGPRRSAAAAPPSGLNAELRPYQKDGFDWLQHLRACDAGGVLADDMGLGKTLQTIAHILAEKQAGRLDRPAMVITLTSLIGNWQRELARFAPDLRVVALTGPQRHDKIAALASAQADVVITTYPLVWRDRDALSAVELSILVLDEAHAIKNPGGLAHDAVRALQARTRVALSGTPIENNLGELWALMDVLNPGLLGTSDEFRAAFRIPIEEHADGARLESLRERVRPYLLRRTKCTVARELPPKTELVRAVELDGAQRELYESIRVSAHAEVRAHIRSRGIGGSQIAILDALLKLRQVCCDPRLVHVDAARGVTTSAKYELCLSMIEQQLAAGHRILLFSEFARMLALLSEGLLGKGIGHVTLTGATADRQRPIDAFEQGRADVFLISLRAGGTGLNLTSADTVIHYDPWWNPTAQAQATDRAYRIGQTKPVFVHSLIAAGSVEERMLGLQQHKRRLADAILGDGGAAGASLSERDVDDLLSPLAVA